MPSTGKKTPADFKPGRRIARIREVLEDLGELAEESLKIDRRFLRLYERRLREGGFSAVVASSIVDEMQLDPQFTTDVKTRELEIEQMALALQQAELLYRTWGQWTSSDGMMYFDDEFEGDEYARLVSRYEMTFIELDRLSSEE